MTRPLMPIRFRSSPNTTASRLFARRTSICTQKMCVGDTSIDNHVSLARPRNTSHRSLSVQGMVEFDSWFDFDPWHLLLIHTTIWHTLPSQLVVWEVLIWLAPVNLHTLPWQLVVRGALIWLALFNFLALTMPLGYAKAATVKVTMNNTNAIMRVLVIQIDSHCYNIYPICDCYHQN